MSAKGNMFHFTRGNSATRRSMLIACTAVCNAALLSFLASSAQAQSSFIWTKSSGGNWSNGANWSGGSPPTVALDSTGDVNLEFNASGSYTSNNDLGPYGVFNMTFDATNGTTNLTGGEIDLANPASEPNNPTFTNNNPTNPVTINNNAVFVSTTAQGDSTQEGFVMVPGSTTTFNGTVTLEGGASMIMTNGQASSSLGGAGGTLIWTQPVSFTQTSSSNPAILGNYFRFGINEGTFEMGGYTIANGTSDAPIINVAGVNVLQSNGVNNHVITDMYLGPEDLEDSHPNDVVAFYLIANGNSMNQPVQIGDAASTTIGGVNTSGTVTFNDFFKTLPTDGNGIYNNAPAGVPFTNAGKSQIIYFSAAAGGTVLQNFALIRGGGSGFCGASVDKIGPGTWIVAGGGTNNTGEQAYWGNTTVRDGTLELEYDDTGTNPVTLPAAAIAAGAPYYNSGLDGGSLGFNAPTNAVQLGDSGTLPTDNIALLTLGFGQDPTTGAPTHRQVLHYINVNNNNPNGTTTIGVADNAMADFQGTITLFKTVVLTGGSGGTANFNGTITGNGGVTVNGTGTVNLTVANSYIGTTTIQSGLLLAGVGFASVGTGDITVNGGAAIFRSTTATAVLTKIKSGFNAGSGYWNGHGINSTAAASDASHLTTVGMLQPATATTFQGQTLGTGDVAVMYTYYGDANLDGSVNGADYQQIDLGFGSHLTGWQNGDFNYDGVVDGSDFSLIDNTFNQINASGAAPLAIIASDATLTAISPAGTVPEPTALGLLAISAISGLGRQRRKTIKSNG